MNNVLSLQMLETSAVATGCASLVSCVSAASCLSDASGIKVEIDIRQN